MIDEAIWKQNTAVITHTSPSNLTFRPSVADPACPTLRLTHVIDQILKPFPIHVILYFKDNIDFTDMISGQIKDSEEMVTLDIVRLNSIIEHELVLSADIFLDK